MQSTASAGHPPEVSIPASTGRRKTRFVRDEDPPDDLIVVVRAAGLDVDATLADMVRDARYSGESYALEGSGGDREVLFGVSVFAVERDTTVAKVLEKFSASPRYLAVRLDSCGLRGTRSCRRAPFPTISIYSWSSASRPTYRRASSRTANLLQGPRPSWSWPARCGQTLPTLVTSRCRRKDDDGYWKPMAY